MATIAESWKADLKEELRGEVKEEVAGEWLAKGKASTTLDIIRDRFSDVPKDVDDTIRGISDIKCLNSLVRHALHCQSLDEFRGVL